MQVLLLILAAVVLLPGRIEPAAPGPVAAIVIGGTGTLVVAAAISSWLLQRGLRGPCALRRIVLAGRLQRLFQWSAVGLLVFGVVGLGWRETVRSSIGDPPLLDEVMTIVPALAAIVLGWWIFQPFERRVRESSLLRELDEGVPVQAPPTRTAWVALQVRTQMLVLLVPLALLVAVGELVRGGLAGASIDSAWWSPLVSVGAALPVLALAPWIVVRVIGTRSLPNGEVRTTLEEMCRRARVGVRDLLLWPTGGSLVNAAVTGFVGRWRWVMMTDGLLGALRREEVMAVMAHELAHARRHHMPWMAAAVLAIAAGLAAVVEPVLFEIQSWLIDRGATAASIRSQLEWSEIVAMGVVLGGTLVGFGWVSRRFERQADAFAAVALSTDEDGEAVPEVSSAAVGSMANALLAVSRSNGVSIRRFSWRHGSIESRVEHLRTLVGLPCRTLPIDRTVRRIQVASILALLATSTWWLVVARGGEGGIA
ncbi:MAG: M48 family metallopeptidase [Planctomycetota bacterium]|nr:M48 family metallopeptidase [Planctomycetota bacterium]